MSIGSHGATCWKDSSEHWECAVLEVERLHTQAKSYLAAGLGAMLELDTVKGLVVELAEAIRDGSDQRLLDAFTAYEAWKEKTTYEASRISTPEAPIVRRGTVTWEEQP